ncbi:MAG: CDP-alcohol phosphatidyltransferase family protein [bacterium]
MGAAEQIADPTGQGFIAVAATPGVLSPATRIAGLPLLVRLARQLEQAGAGVALVADDGDAWRALLERHGVGRLSPLTVVAPAEVPQGVPVFEASAVYDARMVEEALRTREAPSPAVRVEDAASRRRADAWLWDSIRKSVSHDGPVAYYLARPLSAPVSRLLLWLGISPNAITVAGLLVGLASGVSAGLGGYRAVLAATLLFALGLVLDCVDGEMARISLSTSRVGQWLDTIVDDLSVVSLTVGLGVGLWRETGLVTHLWAGVGTGALVVVGQAVIYRYLIRTGGAIDTAKYPWFFVGRQGLAQEGKRSLVGWLAFLPRRDTLTLAFVILALVGMRQAILLALVAGGAGYFLLLCIDRLSKALGWVEELP